MHGISVHHNLKLGMLLGEAYIVFNSRTYYERQKE
jgi:hypothetical protein